MATRIAWWLNLDAAFELEQAGRYTPSPRVSERARELVPRMGTLILPEDVVLDGSLGKQELPQCVGLAFCNTPTALAALASLGFEPPPAPPVSVLRALTRRAFCARLGQTLPGAAYVESLLELAAHIDTACFTGEWLLKRDFSFAARERRRIRGGTLDASTLGFAKRSFALGQGLQVEPYVRRAADFAQHGYVCPGGAVLLSDPLLQHCDLRGTWQASEPLPPSALEDGERAALRQATWQAGEALREAGYVGPFGVDAFRYWAEDGHLAFQPRSEINVRFSMGYPRALLERALSGSRADPLAQAAAEEPGARKM
jgi:hypothetical protein